MLKLLVLGDEYYNETTSEFETVGDVSLELEHSLISMSKWESKHHKPFLDTKDKTQEELLSYIECMILSLDFPNGVLDRLSSANHLEIQAYIEAKQTATKFGEMPEVKGRGATVTSELIYYWMVAFTIPFECETWHLNRLFALIRICNIKNSPAKKLSRSEIARRNRDLNERRRAEFGTNG